MSNQNDDPMYNLYFQDLVILKHFMEKAFRENFFNKQELTGSQALHQKLENILQKVIHDTKKKNSEKNT